jgi:CDP-6-deoxy-D-xylo-4-hexulose-3-dehydrase
MQAAVGLAQLKKLEYFIEKRIENFDWLKNKLKKFEQYFILPEKTENSEPAWFGFPITIKEKAPFTLAEINGYLFSHNVDTRPIFTGNITRQPYFKNKKFRVSGSLENSDKIMMRTFWIGVYPGLTVDMMEYVVKTIEDFINFKINTHTS